MASYDSVTTLDVEKDEYKNLFIKFSLFFSFLVVFFALLVLFTLLSRSSWKNGLKEEVIHVLEENQIEDIEIKDFVKQKSVLSCSSCIFEAFSKDERDEKMFVVIIRLQTFFGAVPAVYLYSPRKEEIDFIGFSNVCGSLEKSIKENSFNLQIRFWKNRIPKIISSSFYKDSITEEKK